MAKPKIETAPLTHEQRLWQQGKQIVVGVDEVGRGPLAGPVVVAAIAFHSNHDVIEGVRDSKRISKKQLPKLAEKIGKNAQFVGIGQGTVHEIDNLGISEAIRLAAKRALTQILEITPIHYLLLDGNESNIQRTGKLTRVPARHIIKGDQHCYSIAAASILAKVYRDSLMKTFVTDDPDLAIYGWETNVGYGTKQHRDAIKKHGLTSHHRRSFCSNIVMDKKHR